MDLEISDQPMNRLSGVLKRGITPIFPPPKKGVFRHLKREFPAAIKGDISDFPSALKG